MKSPPFSASRVALVAAATISSTLLDSASRLNFARVCRAAAMAEAVRLRPSSPPAPSRTMSFSRSMTSKDRSGRTWTTIMWMELVPMSMAAMRMQGRAAQRVRVLHVTRRIYTCELEQQRKGPNGRHPTMNTRAPRVTTLLLQRLARGAEAPPAAGGGGRRSRRPPGPGDVAAAAGGGAGAGHRPQRQQGGKGAAQDPAADARARNASANST